MTESKKIGKYAGLGAGLGITFGGDRYWFYCKLKMYLMGCKIDPHLSLP